jgi:hypothetical protein
VRSAGAWVTVSRVAGALLLASATPALVASAQGPGAAEERVRIGTSTSADTVTVGDPFRIAIRVRAPLGSTIEFPAGPDSTATVQLLDPMTPAAQQLPDAVDQTATYRVAAWDVDSQRIELGELVVRTPAGVRRAAIAETVFVRSVLPADSTERVPKPVRPIFASTARPWWLWLLAAAAALVAFLVWWWWRRRRRPGAPLPEDAYARAQEEFERVERLRLVEAGERGRYVALVIEVLRDYLQARHPDALLSHTSTELLLAMRGRAAMPMERLGAALAEADLVKFARRPVTPERARHIGLEARAIVTTIEQAYRRALAAEEAERQARAARAGKEAA